MLINEFASSLKLFVATVRVRYGNNTTTVKTALYAEGPTQAKQLLSAAYGENAIVSLALTEDGVRSPSGTQTLSAEQLAKKSAADARARDAATAQDMRMRKKVATAQRKAVSDAAARFKACQ